MAEEKKENKVLTMIKGCLPTTKKQIVGTSVIGVGTAVVGFVAGRLSKKGAKKATQPKA